MLLFALAAVLPVRAQVPRDETYPRIHDPSTVVEENGATWCLSTGNGVLLLKREQDGRWKREAPLFKDYPAWHKTEVPENKGHLWAPDIIRVNDKWFIYYSVSSFGSNHSAIGLLTGKTLDPASKDYGWKDEGVVIRSRRPDRFNAIDPAVILDDGKLWMSYGSFWEGIFLIELDPETGLRKNHDAPLRLAMYPEIEAPFIHKNDGWYYLFVNWGKCCRGVDSTYEIRVGRSRKITGPYLDKDGTDMKDGGGSPFLATQGRHIGPGHASIFRERGKEWLVHHYYDRERRGRSDLRMLPLKWQEGWPAVE
ncbi:arabinan endo-1,5-alpha-L-arabinosidase [Luteolibacter flavescens]|uniref:Arabinan endo-1,5-alpha-L-arabinosidase n=1 Tax=Luteolibacter flavescens TaxID=1859460 RepID=A0ABT3FLG1_9BACT|nr:arabinan endo-1,5-alpha-L-arabinosidase [Luteolibacter flavescens]MCW1884409.1 arabinan endo-1,5-alpha-L-arabinosidase [Luteolibacter flavescens]